MLRGDMWCVEAMEWHVMLGSFKNEVSKQKHDFRHVEPFGDFLGVKARALLDIL